MTLGDLHMMLAALLLPGSSPVRPGDSGPASPLQPISRETWRSAGVGGTGCWWRHDRDQEWRLAMSDRTAVVRVAGRVVVLAPGPGARELFPFTFDRWRGEGVFIRIRRAGRGRRAGIEALEVPTRLEVMTRAGRSVRHGEMVCGS